MEFLFQQWSIHNSQPCISIMNIALQCTQLQKELFLGCAIHDRGGSEFTQLGGSLFERNSRNLGKPFCGTLYVVQQYVVYHENI